MSRELKRVPLDFDYPLDKVWYGYLHKGCFCKSNCDSCLSYAKIKGIPLESNGSGCPDFEKFYKIPTLPLEPPVGVGYQLWETVSEGSPISPVFKTLEALCEWCEDNATTFADYKATKEEWLEMLNNELVYHQEGNITYI